MNNFGLLKANPESRISVQTYLRSGEVREGKEESQ